METLFYRQKRVFALALLVIIAVGVSSLLTIARQEDPTITNLFATIITPYPGAGPDRVEALVTEKIEEQLREISQIDEITSVSSTGISSIQVELSEFIADEEIEQAWSEIRDALADAAVNFPPGVPDPTFDNDRTSAYTAISAVVARDGADVPLSIIARYGERLQDRLRGILGTKYVKLYGEPGEEIRVEVDRAELAGLGLTVDDISAAISRADAKVQAGRVTGADTDYLIEVSGEIETLDRIRHIPLVVGDTGPLVRVGDVAEVRRAEQTPAQSMAFANGDRAVVIAARMEPDLQVDGWMAAVKAEIATFEAELPAGLEHQLLFDQSIYTWDRLAGLSQNLMIGMSLVVMVLLVTLGWRSALVVAIMLPLASLLSIAVLQRIGIPIQQMSVTGLIVALGLLVDAAIVMTDDVKQRLRDGSSAVEAVGAAVRRLTVPLLASTVTTVLAFMPMVLLPGPVGDFIGSIAISVIVMLVASFALALTITPALAAMMLVRPRGEAPARWWREGLRGGALSRVFAASLDLSLRHRGLAVLGALILPLIGFGAFPTLTAQFFPGVERDQFYIQMTLPEGTSITRTQTATETASALLRAEEGIVDVHWFIGESAPAFYYNMMANRDRAPGFAEALITTTSHEATAALLGSLQPKLDDALPQAQVVVRGLVQGPPVAAPVEMRLVGPSLTILRELGDEARARMAALADVTHTRADLIGGAPKLIFDLDENKVRLAGLQLADVANQLSGLLEGVTGGSLIEGTEELPVRVRLGIEDRDAADRVTALSIVSPAGDMNGNGAFSAIPLSALGEVRLVPSDSAISRRSGERVNTVQAYLQDGVLPEETLARLQADLADNPLILPAGYRIEWGGDSDARAETIRNLMSSIGLIVTLMIACIVLTFNSFRLSLIAGAVVILSMGLSLLALAVFQYPFGFQALLGVIGSTGVSINAAIIIISALKQDADARRGDPEAIRNVVLSASRHIVSTTVTTFGGFLPLILAGGGFWPPFAMSIAGGVLLSTVVSFYFVPPMFSLFVGRTADSTATSTEPIETSAPMGPALLQAAE
jgi:multidrug efflux pump subunit AcrB